MPPYEQFSIGLLFLCLLLGGFVMGVVVTRRKFMRTLDDHTAIAEATFRSLEGRIRNLEQHSAHLAELLPRGPLGLRRPPGTSDKDAELPVKGIPLER